MKKGLSHFLCFGDVLRDGGGEMYRCTSHMPWKESTINVVPCAEWDDYRRACLGIGNGNWRDYVRQIPIESVEPARMVKLYDAETGSDFYVKALTEFVFLGSFKGVVDQRANNEDVWFYFCAMGSDDIDTSRICCTYEDMKKKQYFHFRPCNNDKQGKEVCA